MRVAITAFWSLLRKINGDHMDFESAFHRERAARKKAEQLLEGKSRELYFANQELSENVDSLNEALLKNNFLMSINRYGSERQKLRNFLPIIIREMLSTAKMPFGYFDHYSFDPRIGSYRSEVVINDEFVIEGTLKETFKQSPFDELMNALSCYVSEKKQFHRSEDVRNITDDNAKKILLRFEINEVIALPIFSLEHMAGVIYLFTEKIKPDQRLFVQLFHDAMQQLGIMIEHRHQEDKLRESYEEIKVTNDALKKAQKQLIQSEKMASVGQLSAGIAHEINNPMGFIKSNIGSLVDYIENFEQYIRDSKQIIGLSEKSGNDALINVAKKLDANWQSVDMEFLLEDSSVLLKESQQGIERVVDIVGGLKRFARQSDNTKEPCNICDIVEEALKLANNELKYTVNINKSLEQVKVFNANSGELTQVFLNILINAAQAIEDDGDITITVFEENEGAAITIADTGCGIDQKYLDTIFDPFFTTKEIGVGTGLGLSISYGIIEDHGGIINVKSEVGKGTEFYIWLPYNEADEIDTGINME